MSKTLKNIVLVSIIIGIVLLCIFEFIWLGDFPWLVKVIVPPLLLVIFIIAVCIVTYSLGFFEGYVLHKTNISNITSTIAETCSKESEKYDSENFDNISFEELIQYLYYCASTDTINAIIEEEKDLDKYFFPGINFEEEA